MKDRISTYPGRIKLTPVDGEENKYTLEWADEPTQVGTPLSKATFLPDTLVKRLKLLQDDPTVADALDSMAATMEKACKVTVGEEPPTASTFGDAGDEYIQTENDTELVIWKCIQSADSGYKWVPIFKTVKKFHTEIFTTSSEFVAEKNIVGNAHIICVGGGGGGCLTNSGGGGGSGYIRQYTGGIPIGKHTITVGAAGGDKTAGGASSFGTLVSAPGGGAGGYNAGGSGSAGGGGIAGSGGNGELGGGGGAGYGDSGYVHSAPSVGYKGGNGGTYGGGGGGATRRWYLYSSDVQDGVESNGYVFGNGGNSAKHSGATSVQSGEDRNGGGAGYSSSAVDENGGAGEDTTELDLEFTGTGLGGTGKRSIHGAGGGGGYGGNGGDGGSSGTGAGSGGGGGYGGNGGNGGSGGGGGGGGGWGADGGNGGLGGGGGGGYGAANYGGGGSGDSNGSNSGVVIVEYWTYSAEVIS